MRSLNQIIYLRPSSLKFIQQHYELKVDFIFRLQKRNYSKLSKRISSDELDFDFILENKKLENKMKGQKVRAYISQLRNRSAHFLTETLEDISKAYVLGWHIEETTQNRCRIREFFWSKFRGCITRILGELSYVQYIVASYHKGLGTQIKSLRNFSVLFGVMRQKLYQVLVGNYSPKDFQALFKYTC